MAVGAVALVLQLQGALIQEGDELPLQPLEVAVREVGRSIEGELSDVLATLIQGFLQPLILHTGADHGDALSHLGDDIGVGEVLDGVGDIGPGFLRQAHLDVRPGGNHELLEVVAERSVDGMGVLLVGHGGVEVHLLDTAVAAQIEQHGLIEVDLRRHIGGVDGAVVLPDVQQQVHGVLTGAEVRLGALGDGDVLLRNDLAVDLDVGALEPHITVDAEAGVLTLQQGDILGVHLDAVDQGIDLDLGPLHEGNLGVGGQGVDQILVLLLAGGADGRDDLLDLHGLLVDGAGIEQTMQDRLVGNPHGGRDAGRQSDQIGLKSRLGDNAVLIQGGHAGVDQVVVEHLSDALGILVHQILELLADVGTVVLVHQLSDALGHSLDLNSGKCGTSNRLIHDGTFLEPIDDVSDVAAFRSTAKQCTHSQFSFQNLD